MRTWMWAVLFIVVVLGLAVAEELISERAWQERAAQLKRNQPWMRQRLHPPVVDLSQAHEVSPEEVLRGYQRAKFQAGSSPWNISPFKAEPGEPQVEFEMPELFQRVGDELDMPFAPEGASQLPIEN